VLASAVVSSYSNVLVKKHLGGVAPALNTWGQTFVGAVFLLLCAALFERGRPAEWTPSALASLAYLALFGTALTFVGLFWLVPRVPVSVIGTIPLVDTLIAILLGAWILGEKLSARVLFGGLLILSGVALAVRARPAREVPNAP
jgi:drug/metabolite transporter (DMT)-like permease